MDVENSPVVEDFPHLAARPILRPPSPGICHQHGTNGITEDLLRRERDWRNAWFIGDILRRSWWDMVGTLW